jgi:hypothetical protein
MDGLALLCNLFTDGPVTLKRLRLARVESLSELERTTPERLAEWLHASVPQARVFIEEARRLLRRLAEEGAPARALERSAGRPPRSRAAALVEAARREPGAREEALLRPGLLPGLDEALCARLHQSHVRTVQALGEFAGLALSRQSGIPYSTLLELARAARRYAAGRAEVAHGAHGAHGAATGEVELVPFLPRARRAPAERELARTDEFTLPEREPSTSESAGPFG